MCTVMFTVTYMNFKYQLFYNLEINLVYVNLTVAN